MRRIYESDAVSRDDEDPFRPGEREYIKPQTWRSISGAAWSRRLVPHWVRRRAISLELSTPKSTFDVDEPIPFRVEMRNRLPIPITLRTQSPVRWSWYVDDLEEASHVPLRDPPDTTGALQFDRGERRRFEKSWSQLFRTSKREWEPASPGEYTISASINVADPASASLYDETTVRIEPDR